MKITDKVKLILGEVFTSSPNTSSFVTSVNGKSVVLRQGGRYKNINLRGANLANANLQDIDLEGADLTDAILSGAQLRRANLKNAKLDRAVLAGADLTGAILDPKENIDNVVKVSSLREKSSNRKGEPWE
ncbi:pentapeptide repeat-containing protein [Geomonas nitrogeniifigens]|uniref:pentapeptide repeat-containing protein n=1 Tax=Geomonas diazotrophica TaxID=2843197 RepID=UPI001C2C57D4|nr:pentapeptide repeat-containing protein [Geomonas nitrogeniifigens]QXE86899.1 pentapeptide repeat-containing protein [Geomonas nitrogeniifigens]